MEKEFEQQPTDFHGRDLAQELEQRPGKDIERLSADLFRDYYQSFRLAQFETDVQEPLFEMLAEQHHLSGNTEHLAAALKLADHKIDDLLPPARHAQTTAQDRSSGNAGFRALWDKYVDILTRNTPAKAEVEPPEGILESMLTRDIHYQRETRPRRPPGADKHESVTREYILGDKLTGSEQLMRVRDQLRATFYHPTNERYAEDVADKTAELVRGWEVTHPGMKFIAPADSAAA